MDFTLKIWRQKDSQSKGKFETIQVKDIPSDASFLEMFDIMNEDIVRNGGEPVAYDHDCREGICGMCSMHINGRAHGPGRGVTTCQLYMRKFKDGQTIWIEPWRAKAFPVIKDLMIDRTAFDKINQAGGYISVNTGSATDGNAILVPKDDAEMAMDAASCIGCGACVATCKNASAMLFVAAKVSHFAHLPQGKVEAGRRVKNMIAKMEELGFGSCTNTGACEVECPKNVSITHIAKLNRQFLMANAKGE